MFIGLLALTVWAVATSPFNLTDAALDLFIFFPVLLLLLRFTGECVLADPRTEEIRVRNIFRTRHVAWSGIDRFEVTDKRIGKVIPTQIVTCVLKDGQSFRVRAAGRWVRQNGYGGLSLTGKKTLSLIAQELNIRRHQHEYGLPMDQLPQPW